MPIEYPHYTSYLLRIWSDDTPASWRATLENVSSRERHNFTNLDSLIAFLQKQTGPEEKRKGGQRHEG